MTYDSDNESQTYSYPDALDDPRNLGYGPIRSAARKKAPDPERITRYDQDLLKHFFVPQRNKIMQMAWKSTGNAVQGGKTFDALMTIIRDCLLGMADDRAAMNKQKIQTPKATTGNATVYQERATELWEKQTMLSTLKQSKQQAKVPNPETMLKRIWADIDLLLHPDKDTKKRSFAVLLKVTKESFEREFDDIIMNAVRQGRRFASKHEFQKALSFQAERATRLRRGLKQLKDLPPSTDKDKIMERSNLRTDYDRQIETVEAQRYTICAQFFEDAVRPLVKNSLPLVEWYGELHYLLLSIENENDSSHLAHSIVLARSAHARVSGQGVKPFFRPVNDRQNIPWVKPSDGQIPMHTYHEEVHDDDGFARHRAFVYMPSEATYNKAHIIAANEAAGYYFRANPLPLPFQADFHEYKYNYDRGDDIKPNFSAQKLPDHLQAHFENVVLPAHHDNCYVKEAYTDDAFQRQYAKHDRPYHEARAKDQEMQTKFTKHDNIYETVKKLPAQLYNALPLKPPPTNPGSDAPHSGGGPSGGARAGKRPAAEASHQVHNAPQQLAITPKVQNQAAPHLGQPGHAEAPQYHQAGPSQLQDLLNLPEVPKHTGGADQPDDHQQQQPISSGLPTLQSPVQTRPGTPKPHAPIAIAEEAHPPAGAHPPAIVVDPEHLRARLGEIVAPTHSPRNSPSPVSSAHTPDPETLADLWDSVRSRTPSATTTPGRQTPAFLRD